MKPMFPTISGFEKGLMFPGSESPRPRNHCKANVSQKSLIIIMLSHRFILAKAMEDFENIGKNQAFPCTLALS